MPDEKPPARKVVNCRLVGTDGNAFALLGRWRAAAKREGWTSAEIKAVCDEAMSSDYGHLVATLADHCESP